MKNLLFLLLFLIGTVSNAQKSWFQGSLFSSSAYYLDDAKTSDFTKDNRFRSNNYLRITGGSGKFTAGVQVESYLPEPILNFSPNLNKDVGLGSFYLRFKTEKLRVTAGSFYAHFGSGMILRFWEDKQLGIDNSLRGLHVNFKPLSWVDITALYGKQRMGFEISSGAVFGLNSEVDLSSISKNNKNQIRLGMSYVQREQEILPANPDLNNTTAAYSGRIDISNDKWYSKIEYVHKAADALVENGMVNPNSSEIGNGMLVNLGFSKKGFGIDANFRRVENMGFYSDREVARNTFNEQLINYIPALTNQYDYSLANIYLYQSQYQLGFIPLNKSGEIGNQITMYYSMRRNSKLGGKYGTKFALNFSSWYGLKAKYNDLERSYVSEYFSFGERYFTEVNMEMRKKWSKKWSGIFNFINIYYNKRYIEESIGEVNATLLLADVSCNLGSSNSIRFEGQHLWTKDDKKNWMAGTVELNLTSKWSFFVTDLYNYGNEESKIHYYNVGGSYSKKGTRIALNYGRQRGGLLCVGGVCRVVPETTGFGFALSTTF